jgi:hypothetical protein
VADRNLTLDDAGAGCTEHLAELGLCPHRSEGADARPDDRDGLVS